jgi:rfaE bifunctional protein nucleotidyltransferase chain/domain
MPRQKIKTREEIKRIASQLKKQNKRIVTTNGVFDILHLGHIRYLEKAKKLGDILIVAVNSDSSVRKIKGPHRPLNTAKARAEALAALACVDYVTIFTGANPAAILSEIKPDIHVKGGDYKIGEIIERGVVEKNNGKVVLMPKIRGYSTTELIGKILNSHKSKRRAKNNNVFK